MYQLHIEVAHPTAMCIKKTLFVSNYVYQVMCITDKIFTVLNVSQAIIDQSKQKQVDHFHQVNTRYPYLEY